VANKDRPISFNAFPRYVQDFRGYFLPKGTFGDYYRQEEVYRACAAAHPEFVLLSMELQAMKDFESPEYITKLYEAYTLMRRYAKRDQDILIAGRA
jgi:hypothetical protein